jgi:hypothetical protein
MGRRLRRLLGLIRKRLRMGLRLLLRFEEGLW